MKSEKLETLRRSGKETLLKSSLNKKTLFKIQKLYIKYKNLKDGLCNLLHDSS